MKRVLSMLLCALLISTAFAFFGPNTVVTDVSAEVVEGEGNCFEITNSTYLNVTLCSSEVVNVTLESIPMVVSFTIEATTSAPSTSISMSGFEPGRTYYRHEDGHLIESFVAEEGNYSYTQDISEPHHMFIQEEAGTKYIKDDTTGGDCTSIGTWVSGTKTCTLTSDVYEMIVIDANGVTLDGDGHSVTYGTGSYGIYASNRFEITITNVAVSGFTHGIYLVSSSSNTISGNTVSGNGIGITLHSSSSNTISGNTVSGNGIGIYLYYSSSNTISGNTVSDNYHYYGIYLVYSSSNTVSGNTVSGSTTVGIYLYSSSSNTISGNTVSGNYYGIYLYSSSSNTISGNTVSGNQVGIYLYYYSSSNTISGNTVSGNTCGISLGYYSSSNTISGNTVSGSTFGIRLWDYSSSNTISGNTVSGPGSSGIYLYSSNGNTISGNTVSGNSNGIILRYSSSNTISGNTVSGNSNGIYLLSGSSNNTISGNTVSGNSYGIILGGYSSSNTISGNTVSGNGIGIHLGSSSNTISGNTVSGNHRGIILQDSSSNTISGNTVSGNSYYGILLYSSNSNTIFHNNFIDNTNQLYNDQSTNTWDNGDGEGNYWSDYTGLDDGSGGRLAGDGIGDTDLPHQGVDWFPLMNPWNHDPVDAIEKLKQYIEALDIPHGIKNSLISQLNAAENALSNGQEKAAVNILNAFIHHVEALRDAGKLTLEQAEYMISSAQRIIETIEGG